MITQDLIGVAPASTLRIGAITPLTPRCPVLRGTSRLPLTVNPSLRGGPSTSQGRPLSPRPSSPSKPGAGTWTTAVGSRDERIAGHWHWAERLSTHLDVNPTRLLASQVEFLHHLVRRPRVDCAECAASHPAMPPSVHKQANSGRSDSAQHSREGELWVARKGGGAPT